MPIEIREVIIKAQVRDDRDHGRADAAGEPEQYRELLVRDCVEQVLRILEDKQAR